MQQCNSAVVLETKVSFSRRIWNCLGLGLGLGLGSLGLGLESLKSRLFLVLSRDSYVADNKSHYIIYSAKVIRSDYLVLGAHYLHEHTGSSLYQLDLNFVTMI